MFSFLLFLHFHSCSSFFLSLSFYSFTISFLSFSGRQHKMKHKGWSVVKHKHSQSKHNFHRDYSWNDFYSNSVCDHIGENCFCWGAAKEGRGLNAIWEKNLFYPLYEFIICFICMLLSHFSWKLRTQWFPCTQEYVDQVCCINTYHAMGRYSRRQIGDIFLTFPGK